MVGTTMQQDWGALWLFLPFCPPVLTCCLPSSHLSAGGRKMPAAPGLESAVQTERGMKVGQPRASSYQAVPLYEE